jgi:hypothetical protein
MSEAREYAEVSDLVRGHEQMLLRTWGLRSRDDLVLGMGDLRRLDMVMACTNTWGQEMVERVLSRRRPPMLSFLMTFEVIQGGIPAGV